MSARRTTMKRALSAAVAVVAMAAASLVTAAGASAAETPGSAVMKRVGNSAPVVELGAIRSQASTLECRTGVAAPSKFTADNGYVLVGFAKVTCDAPVSMIILNVYLTVNGQTIPDSVKGNFTFGQMYLEQWSEGVVCPYPANYQVVAEVSVIFTPTQPVQTNTYAGEILSIFC